MPALRPATPWVLLVTALAACQPGGANIRGGDIAGATAAPSVAAATTTPGPDGGSATPAPGASPQSVFVTNFPAATPEPTLAPTPPPAIVRVSTSTSSVTLNTPRDQAAPIEYQDAGFPTRYQLVGMVHYSNGAYTTDVNWLSGRPELVAIDADGWVRSTMPRGTGTAVVTAIARADAAFQATVSVTVVDQGKVQVDVY